MRKKISRMNLLIAALATVCIFSANAFASSEGGFSGNAVSEESGDAVIASSDEQDRFSKSAESVQSAVDFDHDLDSYVPHKDRYNFYFTYKTVHPWWDAVALGMEEAQRQFLKKGVVITYEYMAPNVASAEDQTERLRRVEQKDYDVIGVDVADEMIISPILDEMVDSGKKVMTFSSSDAAEGCKRIAYVGNTHNEQDGAALAEAAFMTGLERAPCHEDRARGARDTVARYKSMEIVALEYDMDSVDLAHDLTLGILEKYPELDGIICCNMSNPVGAARAITEAGSSAVIVGMDHDQEALHYLKDGIIYCLGVQDCFSIGFDTLQIAVKIADGNLPGELFPEKTNEITTVIYQKDAAMMLEMLYGNV